MKKLVTLFLLSILLAWLIDTNTGSTFYSPISPHSPISYIYLPVIK